MAGLNFPFNIALGAVKNYAALGEGANDALLLVPIETTGIEADDTLNNYDDLAALLAASNNEQTTIGRKTITSATATVDDTNNRTDIDIADQTYTAPTGNAVGKFLVCYDPDTTGGTDSTVVPLTAHAVSWTPDGNDANIVINAAGFFRATAVIA
jgi:hypothetical protein